MSIRLKALILEDNAADAELVLHSLRRAGFDLDWKRVETEEDYVANLSPDLDVILSDYSLPHFNVSGALARLQESGMDIPLIVVTGTISEEVAVNTIKQGAADYLLKDRLSRLGDAVARAIERKKEREAKRRAEAALLESQQRFHSAFESAPIGMALVSPDGHYLQVNRALCEIVGYSKEEMYDKSFQSVTHKDDLKESERLRSQLLDGETTSVNLEKRYLHKRGHPVWAHTSLSLVRDPQGVPSYFIAQIQDIADRKKAEEDLRYRVAFDELIASISTDFITLTPHDIDAGISNALQEFGTFVGVDHSYVFVFSDEGKKLSLTHEWCANGIEPAREHWQELPIEYFPWAVKKLNNFENIYIPRLEDLPPEAGHGKELLRARGIKSVAAIPMVYGKSLIGFLGFDSVREERTWTEESVALLKMIGEIFVNALERKRADEALRKSEEQLLQAQKMESIGTLAGGIAHDFNNLLTVILGNTQLAHRGLLDDDPLKNRLGEIEKASNRASALTRQLLAFGRRQRLERRTLNLNDTINDITKMMRRIIGEDIEMRIKAAPELSPVFADPGQIEQVIVNLVVNARDAMPRGGGLLTIETLNVEMNETYLQKYAYAQPGKYVQIRVSDNGTGMDEQTKARIFEPFFTTKEVGKGTGLGLSMIYGIVKQHEGYINVYSELGHGTTFKIYLPVSENELSEEQAPPLHRLVGGTETILVAEDEEPLRNLARDILEGLGYTVILAENGADAVTLFTENREIVDLIISDVVMPRMGGHEVNERIREMDKDVPIIFMTGYSTETVRSRFLKENKFMEGLGAALIQKPYNVEGLGLKVREVLDAQVNRQ